MKKWLFATCLIATAAMAPAPIKDPRRLYVQPELSDAQRQEQQRGVQMGEVGGVPAITDRQAVPSITGDDAGSKAVLDASGNKIEGDSARKGAAAIQEASREIAQRGKTNWGRIFAGGLILVAAFGLFHVFRMWANKNLPDAPGIA